MNKYIKIKTSAVINKENGLTLLDLLSFLHRIKTGYALNEEKLKEVERLEDLVSELNKNITIF